MIKRFISLLFVAAAPLFGQQQTEPFKAKVDVSLVLLDAVVTDNRGNQILGLGKDDFVVREHGIPQSIEAVDYFTTRKLLNAPEKNAAFNVERVHDERYISLYEMISHTNTQYEALETLANALRPIRARKDLVLFSPGIVAPDEDVRGEMIVSTSRFFEPAIQALNRANVTIYGINLFDASANPPEYVHQNLSRLAMETNGDYFRFHTSFASPLKQIDKRTVGYY